MNSEYIQSRPFKSFDEFTLFFLFNIKLSTFPIIIHIKFPSPQILIIRQNKSIDVKTQCYEQKEVVFRIRPARFHI